jgi:drug/metabolite transporter (DMT)-like permease
MNHPNPDLRSASFLIAASACWGIATVITKHILISIPPITLLTIQLIFSAGLLWPLVFFKGRPLPKKAKCLTVGWPGLLNPGISYTLSLIGLTTTTASMSTLLWASEPILILLLAWIILREQLTPKLILLSLAAISGVILISGFVTGDRAKGNLSGNLLILGGVLCCAFYTVLAQRSGQDTDPLFTVALQQTFALVWAFVILPFEMNSDTLINLLELGILNWFWAGVSGVMYYALAFWFYLQGLARVRATMAGVFINLIPIFGVGGAFLFLGERLAPIQWIGAGAILLSVFAILLLNEKVPPLSK